MRFFGGYSDRATPDPIPNSEVKPVCADGTARETVWESRTLPKLFLTLAEMRGFFFGNSKPLHVVAIVGGRSLTRQLAVSSVTQTWLVSRRQGKDRKNLSDVDGDEQTVTICRPSVVLLIRSSTRNSSEHLNLSFGIHRFLLDDKAELREQNHLEGRADFEIDVNSAGAFFFSLSEGQPICVNGRRVGWIRLRSDDVIAIGDWTLRVNPCALQAEDRTILSRTITSANKQQRNAEKPLWRLSGVAILLVVFPAMLVAALIGGYILAQNEVREAMMVRHDVADVAIQSVSSQSLDREITNEVREKKEATPFGKAEFESLVAEFRAGKEKTACKNLKTAMATADKGVWRSKALLLLKRRCTDV